MPRNEPLETLDNAATLGSAVRQNLASMIVLLRASETDPSFPRHCVPFSSVALGPMVRRLSYDGAPMSEKPLTLEIFTDHI